MGKHLGAALMLTALCGLVAGCSSDSGTATETPPVTTDMTAGGTTGTGPVINPDLAGGNPGLNAPVPGGRPVAGMRSGGKGPTSWDGAPSPVSGAGTGTQGGPPMPGGPGNAGGGPSAGDKPTPIRPNVTASGFRSDPFVSFRIFKPELPPAYSLAIPHRLASQPRIEIPADTRSITEILGPLPPVPRRVAGVLYNGAITAILETGTPPDSEVVVIQPGASVASGIPGVGNLTVESVTMERLVLRALDGRTVEVKLSGLPPSVSDALRSQFGNGGANGALNGGFPGGPDMTGGGGKPSIGAGVLK